MNKFIPLSDVYANLGSKPAQAAAAPPAKFKTLTETYVPTTPIPHARLAVYLEDVDLLAHDTQSNHTHEYTVEKEWWDNVISHYLSIQKNNPNIGSDTKTLFDICIDKKVIKTSNTNKYVGQLDYLTSIMDYIYDIADDAGEILHIMQQKETGDRFISFLNSNVNKKANIFDWLKSIYGVSFTQAKESVVDNIWQNLRPVNPGQTRGYAGPAEVPVILFCGGSKASVGDIEINSRNLELKANKGRIGSYSKWIQDKKTIEGFLNSFGGEEKAPKTKRGTIEQQVRDQMNELEDTVVDSPDTAALKVVGAQGGFAAVPTDIIASAKLCIQQGIITNKQQAIMFIGICQLIDYATNQNYDWVAVIKHSAKKLISPKMGTIFTMSRSELADTSAGLYAPEKIYKFMQILATNKMNFDKMYDKDGYGIIFASDRS